MTLTNVRVKSEQFCSKDGSFLCREGASPVKAEIFIKQEHLYDTTDDQIHNQKQQQAGRRKRKKRAYVPDGLNERNRVEDLYRITSIRAKHRCRLDALLQSFIREQRWHEAAGVLSVLLMGAPSHNISDRALHRYHTAAMELHRQLFRGENMRYQMLVCQIYEMWMNKFSHSSDNAKKKNVLMVGLALFFIMQGKINDAYDKLQFVIQDHDMANEPYVNLLHGMILYQLWYSGLPDEYKIKDFNIFMPIETYGVVLSNCYKEMDIGGSSNSDNAAVTDFKISSPNGSESSIGNDKKVIECKNEWLKTGLGGTHPPQEFYKSQSADINEPKSGLFNHNVDLRNSSIFFSDGLDTSLLPINLRDFTGDLEQQIYRYRKLANEHHTVATKHLRLALHSEFPLTAALLPLIQLLLLGDRVEEAFEELEYSCCNIDGALPFRLMARLLECFQRNKVALICSYSENALRRDPLCYHSLQRLMKMHRSGDCSTMLMFKMIALHLDVADGKCDIWEEFASCFLRHRTALRAEYEDCSSQNMLRGPTCTVFVLDPKLLKAFTEKDVRISWNLRFKWWKTRHFSVSSVKAQGANDPKMLCFKAACAAHIYGPSYDYVVSVFTRLRDENDDHASILDDHMHKAMNLFKHL